MTQMHARVGVSILFIRFPFLLCVALSSVAGVAMAENDATPTIARSTPPRTSIQVTGGAPTFQDVALKFAPLQTQPVTPSSPPSLQVLVEALNFGEVEVGKNKVLTLTIANTGTGDLFVTGVSSDNGRFSVSISNFTVSTSSGKDILITFSPSAAGVQNGKLTITSSAGTRVVRLSGVGVLPTPDITATPTSIGFGAVRVGQVQKITLTVQNRGSADLTVDSLSADNPSFAVPLTPFKLTPNAKREIEVTFTPSTPDSIQGILKIASNDPDQPTLRIPLVGVGQAPKITATPASVDFKRAPLDSSVSQIVTIKNTGTFDLSVDSVAVSGKGPFSVLSRPFILKPDSSQKIDVRFTPTEMDSLFGAFTVFSNAFNNARLTVQMKGTGVSPRIATSPEKIDFGVVAFGDTSSAVLIIRNEGNDPLVIQKITISDQKAFSLSDSAFTLAPKTVRSVRIRLKSLTPGEISTEINIQSNDRRRRTVTVPVSASSRPVPDIALADTSHAYEFVTAGVSTPWTLTIRNVGTERLTIARVTADSPFVVQSDPPKTVAVSDSVRLVISFSPSEAGDFKGRLTILTDDPDEREVYVALSGSAVKIAVSLDLDPAPGNQKALSVRVSPSAPIQMAAYVGGVSEISAYSFVMEFDSTAVRLKSGSEKTDKEDTILRKSGGNALSLPPLVSGNTVSFGAAILGPTAGNVVSGDGFLGVLTFEGLEKFKVSGGTQFILRQINLKGLRGGDQKILTRVVAEVKSGIPGDFNGDGKVDFDDFFLFAEGFGRSRGMPGFDPKYDLNADGAVDFSDFFIFAESFGKSR